MQVTEIKVDGYEKVLHAKDEASGLNAIISVHNTNLGPAVGGTRLYNYANEQDALSDVLRLSRGMTYKSSLAGIDFGGGKSVIIARPEDKTPELLRAFGRFVDLFGGRYICAEDVNTSTADMTVINSVTPHVLGLEGAGGDPSPWTALGVVESIRVTAKRLGIPMDKLSVAIQGIGHVGEEMVRLLRKDGSTVYIADLRAAVVEKLAAETGAIVVATDKIVSQHCDIFSPCAMGGAVNDNTINLLQCKAVVGCANNQLAEPRHGDELKAKGILYAPDYLVNAGGIINVFFEKMPSGYQIENARAKIKAIGNTLAEIYALAEQQDVSPAKAPDSLAERRFRGASVGAAKAC